MSASLLAYRPEYYIGTEDGGNQFLMTRHEVAKCLRTMRGDAWSISKDRRSFKAKDLLGDGIITIIPTSLAGAERLALAEIESAADLGYL
jgi:hypothetical protein